APMEGPFGGTPWPIPGTIECENFDVGGEGNAYHDSDPNNSSPNTYRNDTNVEIQSMWLSSTYYATYVSNPMEGEWLNYTVNVTQTGTYQMDVNTGYSNGGTFHVEVDGVSITGPLSSSSPSLVSAKGFYLTAGQHNLRIVMNSSFFR